MINIQNPRYELVEVDTMGARHTMGKRLSIGTVLTRLLIVQRWCRDGTLMIRPLFHAILYSVH
jgi:hypothetical protein